MILKILVCLLQILIFHNANAFQLKLEAKIIIEDSVWIGGPIPVEVSLINKSKRSKQICLPDENDQTYYYIRNITDSVWIRIGYSGIIEEIARAHPPKLKGKEIYKFNNYLTITSEKSSKSMDVLIPDQEYILRITYFNKTKKWKNCSNHPKWSIHEPNKFGALYKDVKFHTNRLDTTELKAYQWIKEKDIGQAFVDRYLYYSWSAKDKEYVKQFISLFPHTRFAPWAAELIVNSNISIYVSTERDVKRLRENKSELGLVQTCIDILLRSKNMYFRETGERFSKILEMYK